jgi:chromosome segregation ATPase
MDIRTKSKKISDIIKKLRDVIENIHKAKHNRNSKDLYNLILANKSLLMSLRRNQREIIEMIEKSKERLALKIEKTDEMQTKLDELKYEKSCIENEIFRIRRLDTEELACLGIPITGEKEDIMAKLQSEFQARSDLKAELIQKEENLTKAKNNLADLSSKINKFSDYIQKLSEASEPLQSLITNID